MSLHSCKDNSDIQPLYPSRNLFLKPISRVNISVHYPELKQSLSSGGKSVSSWDIMERVKALVTPDTFIFLKVVKNTLEFIRFEGDLENRDILKRITTRLEGKTMKVTGFKEALKIKAVEAKSSFPSKYDWDSYFRDAKNMNEMKAGERPDTIHFQNLPSKWFSEEKGGGGGDKEKVLPSEKLFKRIWGVFGEVRGVDIPVCDPYRSQLSTGVRGIKTFTFSNDDVFEGYVQYKEYMSFVKAMDALRGCALFHQEGPLGKYWVANIKVDFDKSKHLSEDSTRKRKIERDRLEDKDKVKKTAEKISRMEAEVKEKKEQEKERKESEKHLAKIEYKIAMEERKYLIARRKLEAIRLMDYLFETIKRNILEKADKKRILKEKIKSEMRKLERSVMEKNAREREAVVAAAPPLPPTATSTLPPPSPTTRSEEKTPSKVRRLQSSVSVVEKKEEEAPHSSSASSGEDGPDPITIATYPIQARPLHEPPPPLPSSSSYSNRYLGDWEVKAPSEFNNYYPPYHPPSSSWRGAYRGRPPRGGAYRGRGSYTNLVYHPNGSNNPYSYRRPEYGGGGYMRGGYHHHHHHPSSSNSEYNGPVVVQHNYSYLNQLDRAYEKYFSSITKRHTEGLGAAAPAPTQQ